MRKATYNYCTLFDSGYLTRAIAMIESLNKFAKDFHIFVLAFDDTSYDILQKRSLQNISVISLKQFENKELLSVKGSRTRGEYCWTCTPSIIKYCIETFNLASCTYIDADLYFFANPNVLIDEMGEKSILITPHNYTPRYDQSKTSGIYCVQFMCFKADSDGLRALNWWKDECIKWCFARVENNKFGDQKYLDDWPIRFSGVHIAQNLGCGLAPWNIERFENTKPIFYHFHNLKFINDDKVNLGAYKLPKSAVTNIYTPYIKHLLELRKEFYPHNFDLRGKIKLSWKSPLRYLKAKLNGAYNVYWLSYFEGK